MMRGICWFCSIEIRWEMWYNDGMKGGVHMGIDHFSEDVLAKLGNYVYAYARQDGTIFYVGRGSTSKRALSHLTESCNDEKSHNWDKLNEIDENTQVFIIHSGMNEEEAKHCETAMINLCRFINPDLTNIKEGDKYRHKMLSADVIENTLTDETVLLEDIFASDDRAAVLAYSEKHYFKSPILSDEFYERLQHEDGFRLHTSEIEYVKKPPKLLCIIHDKVIRGIYVVESEIQRDYVSESSAYAYITFELGEHYITPEKYRQFIGRRIEKRKSDYTIKEKIFGMIYFLY